MLSEHEFIKGFSSFWRDTIPFCEAFIRHLNMNFVDAYADDVTSTVAPNRRALVNEVAFELYAKGIGLGGVDTLNDAPANVHQVYVAALERMRRFHNFGLPSGALNIQERAETFRLARRTEEFFKRFSESGLPLIHPRFPGWGIMDAVEGDVLVSGTLFEVKGGDRRYRGVDIRQLLTYCALNASGQEHDIRRVGLVNPRTGTHFSEDVGVLCVRVSGESAESVIGRIQEFLSGALASP